MLLLSILLSSPFYLLHTFKVTGPILLSFFWGANKTVFMCVEEREKKKHVLIAVLPVVWKHPNSMTEDITWRVNCDLLRKGMLKWFIDQFALIALNLEKKFHDLKIHKSFKNIFHSKNPVSMQLAKSFASHNGPRISPSYFALADQSKFARAAAFFFAIITFYTCLPYLT